MRFQSFCFAYQTCMFLSLLLFSLLLCRHFDNLSSLVAPVPQFFICGLNQLTLKNRRFDRKRAIKTTYNAGTHAQKGSIFPCTCFLAVFSFKTISAKWPLKFIHDLSRIDCLVISELARHWSCSPPYKFCFSQSSRYFFRIQYCCTYTCRLLLLFSFYN